MLGPFRFHPLWQQPYSRVGWRAKPAEGMIETMKDAFDFSGKVALVTGSSRGIGAAIITALGQQGARCAVNYMADAQGRNKADADRVAQPLADARVIQCDVGESEQVSAMMK